MLGCVSRATARASRSTRERPSGDSDSLVVRHFRATRRSSRGSWPRNTSPMPPAPSFSRIRYGPTAAPVTQQAPGSCGRTARIAVLLGLFQTDLDALEALVERAARAPLDDRAAQDAQPAPQGVRARAVRINKIEDLAGIARVARDRARQRRVDIAARAALLRPHD